jgi:uncharacterized membrane protein YkvA (DUF1232 family)
MSALDRLKVRAREIRRDAYALYLACQDPRTPWYAKLLAAAVAAYAFSPIDLIPDFIPLLGYLDDLILIPAGILLAIRLIPAPVLAACRMQAAAASTRPSSKLAAAVVIGVWVLVAAAVGFVLVERLNGM